MKTTLTITIVLAILFVASPSFGEDNEPLSWNPECTFSTEVWSKYVTSTGSNIHNRPVIQSSLTVSLPENFYLNFWHSAGFNDGDLSSDYADEIDYTLGWKKEINGLDFAAQISYFDVIELFGTEGGDFLFLKGQVGKTYVIKKHTLNPYLAIKGYFTVGEGLPGGGTTFSTGLKHSFPLSDTIDFNHRIEFNL